MKKKTKQDFQELLKTEHCKKCWIMWNNDEFICSLSDSRKDGAMLTLNPFLYLALLEDFGVRECIGFIEEHINRQVC